MILFVKSIRYTIYSIDNNYQLQYKRLKNPGGKPERNKPSADILLLYLVSNVSLEDRHLLGGQDVKFLGIIAFEENNLL